MEVVSIQVCKEGISDWITVNQRAAVLLVEQGWEVRRLVVLADVGLGLHGLTKLVRDAQTALTEHLSPTGPSKADTIDALNALLLGAPAMEAFKAIGVPA